MRAFDFNEKNKPNYMRYKAFFLYTVLIVLAAACSNNNQGAKSAQEKKTDSSFIKVYVEKDGRITADEKETSLSDLDSSFSRLKSRNGTVYYSRDNGQSDPPPEAMKVMELIVKYKLPVRLYTDKTFTETIHTN
jgi:biopolymer transport protein ExbD